MTLFVSAIDQGIVVALDVLDIISALDTVDHSVLLSFGQTRFSVTDLSLVWFVGSDHTSPNEMMIKITE